MATRAVALVLDSFAWVEYLKGTSGGQTVEEALRESASGTPVLVLAELADKYHRERIPGLADALNFIEAKTTVLPLTRGIAERAGKTKAEMRRFFPDFPLADAIIYETARDQGAELITGDLHFRRMARVRFLPSG